MKVLTSEEEANLRDALKRCPQETVEAAVLYRQSGDQRWVRTIVLGVIERFVERDLRPKMRAGDPSLRLAEELAMDSLTMMETVMLLEEVLQITIDNDELRPLRTLGDVQTFVDAKLRTPSESPRTGNPIVPDPRTASDWPALAETRASYHATARAGQAIPKPVGD